MKIEASWWKQKLVSVQASLSTNIYCDKLEDNYRFEDFAWMLLLATENAVAGHMRPA